MQKRNIQNHISNNAHQFLQEKQKRVFFPILQTTWTKSLHQPELYMGTVARWDCCDRNATYRILSQDRPEIFSQTKKSHIKLDRYGSTLWIHINGDNTVFNLVSIMEEHFPEEAPDMLKRVIAFLETLERVRFIYLL